MQRILVVEDNPDVLQSVSDALAFEGYEVLEAEDGLRAVQLIREERPDLILCDIMLPIMDGYEVLEEIQSDSETAIIPFIFMTSKRETQDIRKGMALGADDYLTKPFSPDEMLSAVRGRLQKNARLAEQRLRTLSGHLVQAQERERRYIAGELHSQLGQIAAGLRVLLGTARRATTDREAAAPIDEALSLVDELHERVGNLSVDLRPPILDQLGLLPALLQYFQRYTLRTNVRVDFRHTGIEGRFAPDLEIAVFRIIQESLTNVAQHTSVAAVRVQLWREEDEIVIEVEDGGSGFNLDAMAKSGDTVGLYTMQEHAQAVGGQLTIATARGAGTRVIARFPVHAGVTPQQDGFAMGEVVRAPQNHKPALPVQDLRVVLADSHELIRRGLKMLLSEIDSLRIVGETTSPEETLHLVRHLKPDILVADLHLTLALLPQAIDADRWPSILVLSADEDEAYIVEALRQGVLGFVLKDSAHDDIIQAIYGVANGHRYLSQTLTDRVIEWYINVQQAEDATLSAYGTLTEREREIFDLIIDGTTSAEIADQLVISPRTVETHRANIMRKLGLRNQTDLIRYAMKRGLISAD
ncbi:MAG: response regulator [Anaerolineales bacterium]